MLSSFKELFAKVKELESPPTLGIVAADDEHAMEAALEAEKMGLVTPVFIGDEKEIRLILEKLDPGKSATVISVDDPEKVPYEAVKLVHEGRVKALMKGRIETGTLLKAVVDKDKGLGTGRLMTHVALNEIPSYHKLLVTTDGGMVPYPDLDTKKQIIQNAVEVLNQLGYAEPKVACLAAVEKVNPKMPETLEARALKEMNQKGEISGCIVEGPISFDLAFSKDAAEVKGFDSPVAGDADILLVPDITAGNILGKSLVYAANGSMAGIIYGASVPVILTSRGSSTEEKLQSIAFASLIKMEC